MRRPLFARSVFPGATVAFGVLVATGGCSGSSDSSGPKATTPSAIAVVSGNGQVGLIGTALTVPLIVKVTANGALLVGASVSFAVTSGVGTVTPATGTTDAAGQARTSLTFGAAAGNVTVTATVPGTSLTATFVETAGATSITLACTSGAPTAPAVGAVVPGVAGSGVCLSGGAAGSEYALIAFHGNSDNTAVASINVQSHGGVTGVATASTAPAFASGASFGQVAQYHENTAQANFDAALRADSRRRFRPMISGARQRARSSASFSAIPANPAIGSLVVLNANGIVGQACSNAINITARVAAVSNLAIVVADTANPTVNAFTDADYASFAATFDTLVSPLDVANFGQPSDVDKNGKTIIFFTKEVNKLTPAGSDGVIGGFFHERDLFPVTGTADLTGCPTSNFAEIYYSLVPDSAGKFSSPHRKSFVQAITPGTLAHEFQHLINASRRIYVNDAEDFEEGWLNEGLSHIAEELLYYRVAKLTPRQNITINTILTDTNSVNAFNNYQGDNFGRFQLFMSRPSLTGVYADNDDLETRGATWNLLRYLADHRGSADADTWQQLVNSTTSGFQNLANVFSADKKTATIMTQIRDWATSVFADDVVGVADPKYVDSSWNMRSIFPRLVNSAGTPLNRFPLTVNPLSDAQPVNVTIDAGATAYIRFAVAPGASASIDWSSAGLPVTPLMQFTVVRTK